MTYAWLRTPEAEFEVTIPEAIANHQRMHDRRRTTFIARDRWGQRYLVKLDGAAYGVHTTGTGDIVVVPTIYCHG